MSLLDQLQKDLVAAMKAREEARLSAIRMIKAAVMKAFKSMTPPDMSAEDKSAADSNRALLSKAGLAVGGVFVAGLVAVGLMSLIFGFSFLELLKENLVVLMVAASVEFVFLSFFARNYVSLDPNMVKLEVIKALQSYANQA